MLFARCTRLRLHVASAPRLRLRRRHVTLAFAATALPLSACSDRSTPMQISARTLETADVVAPQAISRAVLSDPDELHSLCKPLGKRLAYFEIHTAPEWEALRRAAPGLRLQPDFRHGVVVGLVSRVGQPLDGQWPVELANIRLFHGAGYLTADFHGGSYLPDGTAYVESAFVENLSTVLMIDVNGVRFIPE